MKMTYLMIQEMRSYAPGYKPGSYVGEITYEHQTGSVKLNLTPELSTKILAIVAEDLTAASKEVALNLTSAVITQPQITQQ